MLFRNYPQRKQGCFINLTHMDVNKLVFTKLQGFMWMGVGKIRLLSQQKGCKQANTEQ